MNNFHKNYNYLHILSKLSHYGDGSDSDDKDDAIRNNQNKGYNCSYSATSLNGVHNKDYIPIHNCILRCNMGYIQYHSMGIANYANKDYSIRNPMCR